MPWLRMVPEIETPDDFPRWATDPGRRLEPGESEKDLGWDLDEKGPARWMNWLQENTYQWIKKIASMPFFNWFAIETTMTSPLISVIYSDTLQSWFAAEVSTDLVWGSNDGHAWGTFTAALPVAVVSKAIAIDSARIIVGAGNDVYYSIGGAFTAGGLGIASIAALYTAYPTSDRILVSDATGAVYWATDVTTGIWTAATGLPGATTFTPVIHVTGTIWLVWGSDLNFYISTDNGVSFAVAGSVPAGTILKAIEYNPHSNRLIAVGDDGASGPAIFTSDDLGATWVSKAGGISELTPGGVLSAVQYVGGKMWYTAGAKIPAAVNRETMYVSLDDGETWDLAIYHGDNVNLIDDVIDVASDGRFLISVGGGAQEFLTHSLGVPGPRT